MIEILIFNKNIIKVKILILIINIDKYLSANIFKFCLEYLKTQNFDFWNLAIVQTNKVKISYL